MEASAAGGEEGTAPGGGQPGAVPCGEGGSEGPHRDDVGDALHALAEDVVGEEERLLERGALLWHPRGLGKRGKRGASASERVEPRRALTQGGVSDS